MIDRRIYLVAYLAPALNGFLDGRADLAAACAGARTVTRTRRHLTVLNPAIVGLSEALIAAAMRLAMMAPPRAFRVVLDRLVIGQGRTLIAASEPLAGFRRCQNDLLAKLRGYALDLPRRDAAVGPHVTLGYDGTAAHGVHGIDGISWTVDDLCLIASHHGATIHEPIERWRLTAG